MDLVGPVAGLRFSEAQSLGSSLALHYPGHTVLNSKVAVAPRYRSAVFCHLGPARLTAVPFRDQIRNCQALAESLVERTKALYHRQAFPQ